MRTGILKLASVIAFLGFLSSCGFHLVSDDYRLPPAWSTLSIEASTGFSEYSDLVVLLKQQLRETEGATVVNGGTGFPKIILSGEKFRNPVSALDSFGRAQEYLLEYIVYYQFVDANGKTVLPRQRVYLRLEQPYSSAQILAKEQETVLLQKDLQKRAARRIVERLVAETSQSNKAKQ